RRVRTDGARTGRRRGRHGVGRLAGALRALRRGEDRGPVLPDRQPVSPRLRGRRLTPTAQDAGAFACLTISASSPDWYSSSVMSQPPISSPLTYSCGNVGQFE